MNFLKDKNLTINDLKFSLKNYIILLYKEGYSIREIIDKGFLPNNISELEIRKVLKDDINYRKICKERKTNEKINKTLF